MFLRGIINNIDKVKPVAHTAQAAAFLGAFFVLAWAGHASAQEGFLPPSSGQAAGKTEYRTLGYEETWPQDHDRGNVFFLPAARTLNKGEVSLGILRPVGLGIYYGITNCVTMGVGISPTLSAQLELKWSFIKLRRHTLSVWGFFHYPFSTLVYKSDEGEDFEDGGLMYAGGLLYSYDGDCVHVKLGLIYYDFLMYDEYESCRGGSCTDDTNWYHRWILISPYLQVGWRPHKNIKVFLLVSSFQIRTTSITKTTADGGVTTREDAGSFFWKDLFVAPGIRYFKGKFSMDAGIMIPIVPSKWGGGNYPYVIPMLGFSYIFN